MAGAAFVAELLVDLVFRGMEKVGAAGRGQQKYSETTGALSSPVTAEAEGDLGPASDGVVDRRLSGRIHCSVVVGKWGEGGWRCRLSRCWYVWIHEA